MLNDWIERLGDDPAAEAAKLPQYKLSPVLEGDAPYDIFMRRKPLARQPYGWDPDLDDGVRLNIRPFIEAGILTHAPTSTTAPTAARMCPPPPGTMRSWASAATTTTPPSPKNARAAPQLARQSGAKRQPS